jgi:hypothetical protein
MLNQLTLLVGFSLLSVTAFSAEHSAHSNHNVKKLNYSNQQEFKSYRNHEQLKVYYGLLHAHTGLSDGKGTPEEAYQMAKKNGLDFFAVTDHVERLWFSKKKWKTLKTMAAAESLDGQFVALHGFEWGGTPSWKGWYNHMNFIGTEKVISPLKGLRRVYKTITKINGSFVGQFNHPGMRKFKAPLSQNQWNDFKYNAGADKKVQLIRVGTGYERHESHNEFVGYIPALDNGWHLGPQTSEDNHGKTWGNGHRRTGVWTHDLNREAIISGLMSMATFYTDDSNASVKLIANKKWLMGSTLNTEGAISLDVEVNDPDLKDKVITVELVTYRGKVLSRTASGDHPYQVHFKVNPVDDSYYFVRVLQPDGDRLISAPIFINRD